LANEGRRLFAEALTSDEHRLKFQRDLVALLWARRDPNAKLIVWLTDLRTRLIDDLVVECRTLGDENTSLEAFITRTAEGGDAAEMTVGQFAGNGAENDRINLSSLHSAKGREFRVVILFAMDNGRLPRQGATPAEMPEARRLFYVGFTRPKQELHIVYSAARPSPFVQEVEERLRAEEDQR
jgi:DNA helicase-2/ATP-dependent DNA helicase PcrA